MGTVVRFPPPPFSQSKKSAMKNNYKIRLFKNGRCPYFLIFFSLIILCTDINAYILEPTKIDGKEYISLDDICEIFDISFDFQSYPRKIVLKSENETITLLPFSPQMMISRSATSREVVGGSRVYILESPPKFKDGIIFIPISFIGKAFGEKALESLKEKKEAKIKTIVIDAGHGGKDPGAIGPNGLMEKEINLDVAHKVYRLLNSRLPLKVLMTRKDDIFVPLFERTKFANSKGADLFVSIHCNAAFSPKTKGCETYFVSPALDPDARAVEVLENSVIKLEFEESKILKNNYLASILEDMAYYEFVRESSFAAACVQNNLSERLNLENRGIKQALFYVLRGAASPSILIEIAFISNPEEEAKLATESFRKEVSEAIFNGIKEYLTTGGTFK